MKRFTFVCVLLVLSFTAGFIVFAPNIASACPFCNAETRTLSEELHLADAAVFARLAGPKAIDTDSGNAKFKIVKVLSGEDVLGDKTELETVFFGEPDTDQLFLVSGVGTDYTEWTTPLPLTKAGMEYIAKLADVPANGADRLAFFQEYLENSEPLLAQDAYEEFARAPYAELIELKSRIHHDRLIKWIKDPETNPTRRRLYLTMLGVGGSKADLPMLEEMIVSGYEDQRPLIEPAVAGGLAMGGPLELPTWPEFVKLEERRKKLGLDALIACYMVLRGPDGLNLIDEKIFKAKGNGYSPEVYSGIMALRFLGEETKLVPRERLLASLRLLLDNPEFADQVVTDLARWEDWSVLDRLVNMFKNPGQNSYIRPPVVAYLLAAMEQPNDVATRAKAAMTELEKVDPETVKRAKAQMAFGFLQRARSVAPATGAQRPEATDTKAGTESPAVKAPAKEPSPESSEPSADSSAMIPPDPATFGGRGAAVTPVSEEKEKVVMSTAPTGTDAGTAFPAAAADGALSLTVETSAPARVTLKYAEPDKRLIVGAPLGVTVLLVGVYWMILRSGAV